MNADPNPYPGPDKKRDMNTYQIFVLLPSLRTKSLAEMRCERRGKNEDVIWIHFSLFGLESAFIKSKT